MAEKSKKSSKIENAEVVKPTTAEDVKDGLEETVLTAQEEIKITAENIVNETKDEIALKPEAIELRTSLAAGVLRSLFLIFVGIVLALWGGPKLAPILPIGLSPVAEFLTPGQSDTRAEIALLRADFDEKFANLEIFKGVEQTAFDKAIASYTMTQAEEMAIIKDMLAATDDQNVEVRITSLESMVQNLNRELSAMGERLSTKIIRNDSTLSEETASELSGYSAVLEALEVQVLDLAAKNRVLSQKVAEAATASVHRVKEAEKEVSEQAVSVNIKNNLAAVALALDTGSPFKASLDALSSVAGVKIPEGLAIIAESGTPSLITLRDGFSDVAYNGLRADIQAKADGGYISKFGVFFKTQVVTRSLERQKGPETDAILSRVENDLVNRRLDAALREVNSLPDAAKSAMSDWIIKLGALSVAQSDYNDLSSALGAY